MCIYMFYISSVSWPSAGPTSWVLALSPPANKISKHDNTNNDKK